MLFTYKYIPKHNIYKLQEFLDFLFKEVWLKATGEFNFEKLNGNNELKAICEELEIADTAWGNFFNDRIARIYEEFAKIDDNFKRIIAQWYENNNNIEGVCNDKNIEAITYNEIEQQYPELAKALKSFYDKIYGSDSPFNLKVFGSLNASLIPSHYKEFVKCNTKGVCPFCGLTQIEGEYSEHREAYDHFLPKSVYPFVSLNFKNLAPMCHKCNSTYKKTKVLIKDENGNRTLAFYPYADEQPDIKIEIELKSSDILNLTPNDLDIKINAGGKVEQVESWKRVFDVENRYKNLISSDNVGVAWYQSIVDEIENAKQLGVSDVEKYFNMKIENIEKTPFTDYGFLKKSFLEECRTKGLINADT